jgi:hypothetical protein
VKRGKFGKWEWEKKNDDVAKINQLLFGGAVPGGIRRVPEQIQGWPTLNRIALPIELDPEERADYDKAWSTFCREMTLGYGEDSKNGLVKQLRFRQKSSVIRVPGTVDHVMSLVEQGQSVAVSVQFIETLDRLKDSFEKKGLTVATISGKLPPSEKERQRLLLQRDQAEVVIYTVEEGISLHQGEMPEGKRHRSNVIHDPRWQAIATAQIEGRTHRDGKFSQIYWMFAAETVEEKIISVVLSKVISMKGMMGDDVSTLREIEALITREVGIGARLGRAA